MSLMHILAQHVRRPDPRPIREIDDAIVEELQFHIEMRTQDNIDAGMTPEDARQDAVQRFGDSHRIHRACRQILVGERIMLQRFQTVLTLALVGAVIFLAFAHYRGQQDSAAALTKMAETLDKLAQHSGNRSTASDSAPPVVLETVPKTGATGVDPTLKEIRVVYNKEMLDGSWSWAQSGDEHFPKVTGSIHYLPDGKTCVMPVQLQPGKQYDIWLNCEQYHNFKDRDGRPAVQHYLHFETAAAK